MQRDESMESLFVHWGLIIKIFLYLCQMEGSINQRKFGKERKGSRAFYGSCTQIRSAILRVRRLELVGHFFWADSPLLIELQSHPENLGNFFELNSKLSWLTSYVTDREVSANDVYCLSGHMDLIQKVLNSRSVTPMSPAAIKHNCFLLTMSGRPAALEFFCEGMRIAKHTLLPVVFIGKVQTKSASTQLKESVLYRLCLHGDAAAWRCFATVVTERALKDCMESSNILDVFLTYEHEAKLIRPYSLRALLRYCNVLTQKTSLMNLCERVRKYNRLDLVNVLLELASTKSEWGKVDSFSLRTIVKSCIFPLVKKTLALNPDLMKRMKDPRDSLGCSMVEALLEADDPNIEMLTYFLEELKVKIHGENNGGLVIDTAVFKKTEVLALLLKHAPALAKQKNYSLVSPLQRLLQCSVNAYNETGAVPWSEWCFANVIALLTAGAEPNDIFNLSCLSNMNSNIGVFILRHWPLFDEAIIKSIAAGLNLDERGEHKFPVSYYFLLCHNYMREATVKLILSKPFSTKDYFLETRLCDAFREGCAIYNAEVITLMIEKGAKMRTDTVERTIQIQVDEKDETAAKRCAQFCQELKANGQIGIAGLTGLDLAIINGKADVVQVIVEKIPREVVDDALKTKHLNGCKTTYDLAVALSNKEIIHTIDCLLGLKQTASFSAGI